MDRKKKINLFHQLRKYFVTGALVILPLFLSIYIFFILFYFVDRIFGQFIRDAFGFYIPGIGLIVLVLFIIVVGFLSNYFLGKRLYNIVDAFFRRFPLVRHIYPSLRQFFELLFSKEGMIFKKVVFVQYPVKDSWTLGFITNEQFRAQAKNLDKELLTVFVPLAPNPISGFLIFVPKEDIIFLDISVEEAMKLVLSGGVLNPTRISNNR